MNKKELTVAEKQQANKNWELIEKVTKNSPNCWAEVTRLDIDFCRIQVKGTEYAYEVNLSGALDIIEDMFGLDIKSRVAELQPTLEEAEQETTTDEQ